MTLNQQEVLDFFDYATKNNAHAKQYLLDIYFVLHLHDDLIDKDNQRSDADINMAFYKAMIDIPLNPFYQQNCRFLCNMLHCFYLQWIDATRLQKGTDDERKLSYGLNEAAMDIISHVAFIIDGHEWMLHISEKIKTMIVNHQTYDQYNA